MKRYDIETSIGEDWESVESADGEYVLYDDHLATIATLTAENERLQNRVNTLKVQLFQYTEGARDAIKQLKEQPNV